MGVKTLHTVAQVGNAGVPPERLERILTTESLELKDT